MLWATRQYGKGQIDRAGDDLITFSVGAPAREPALTVINNWRSSHAYPLQVIKMTLLKRAKLIDKRALISQRIKRLPSIALKLQQNPHMKLSQMQDSGGCRAVLRSIHFVEELADVYEKTKSKNPRHRSIIIEKYDYITCPKEDGYRGIHLIYKYQTDSPIRANFNGQRIEIQLRSNPQHVWATAVETAQIFTGQALKSRIKSANESWLRFFVLMGGALAIEEKRPNVPGTPQNKQERVTELRDIIKQLNILQCLDIWSETVQFLQRVRKPQGAYAFLLTLNPSQRKLEIAAFKKEELEIAQENYLKVEKENEKDPQVQVVLVSVDSIGALRRAYPNYYADTGKFIKAVLREIL